MHNYADKQEIQTQHKGKNTNNMRMKQPKDSLHLQLY